MKKFVIERDLPGAGKLSPTALAEITATSCNVVANLNEPYHWIESFVTADKIFCIHIAESEEVVREHASRGNFPVTAVYEVKNVIDPTTI
ncbi:DUF4242 domain-containing protein [Pedobacter boryungensis]|uniref:DUF4242 domain-containing protein n=2 Tax=Pedobacter boryungensis TaxID=869962 RepID=A0ABX2DI76_9SPHI|nr:DUF4242 domain-containing protein [Pedobacter boryungensis]